MRTLGAYCNVFSMESEALLADIAGTSSSPDRRFQQMLDEAEERYRTTNATTMN